MKNDPGLLQYATERQAEYIKKLWECSETETARHFGVDRKTVRQALERVQAKASRQGYAPEHDMTRTVPDGFHVKGVSTYYNEEGKPTAQWVKTNIDAQRQAEIMRHAVDALKEEIPPTSPTAAPVATDENLLNLYPITDYHLGAKTWAEETGADWNMETAEQLLVDWFASAIAAAPAAKFAVFANLGDFLHYDSLEAVTPTNHHVLDADARFQQLIRVNIRLKRRILSMLLQKHEHIYFIEGEGNHDLASSAWGRELFAALYENEPRISVETRPDPYYAVEHGKTSLFFHHGHKKRRDSLETAFIAKFREIFGRTQYSYAHCGHLHHDVVRETNTMHIEQHETLAAPDSHASRGAWLSKRSAKVITYHKEFGEVGRITISPEMLQARNHEKAAG
jgi:hypothetical protein